jgi:hypothetical protein
VSAQILQDFQRKRLDREPCARPDIDVMLAAERAREKDYAQPQTK